MMGAGPVLTIDDLSVAYQVEGHDHTAVDGLSLTLTRGTSVALVGESGSGKSSVVKAVLRLLPSNGRILGGRSLVQGQDVAGLGEEELRRLRAATISLVPQAAMNALDPVIRVDRQIAEVIRTHRDVSRRDALTQAAAALELVGIPPDRTGAYPHQFSGGMRQRALIAMATALRPAVLFADEPTTGLDVVVQQHLLGVFRDLQKEMGLAIVLVTHDLGVAADLCDDVLVMQRGKVVESGPTREVMANPSQSYTRELVAAGGSRRAVEPSNEAESALTFTATAVSYQSGRGLRLGSHHTVQAVAGVSLSIMRGEVVGLAGESGCGKSSLASAALGLVPLVEGQIRIGPVELRGDSSSRDWCAARRRAQMIFQDPYESLNPRFTVQRALTDARRSQKLNRDPEAVREALEMAQLTPVDEFLHRRPHSLSGGERQRVAIARALVVQPDVIIADEPVSMLDRTTANEVSALLTSLAQKADISMLMISHDLRLLRRTCERIAVMYCGRIVELGPTEDVISRPQHPYTRTLIAASHVQVDLPPRPSPHDSPDEPGPQTRGGCTFLSRCWRGSDDCASDVPELTGGTNHQHACLHPLDDPTFHRAPSSLPF